MKKFHIEGFEYQEPLVGPTDIPIEHFTAVTGETQTLDAIRRAANGSARLGTVVAKESVVGPLAAAAEYVMPGVSEGVTKGEVLEGQLGKAALEIAAKLPLTPTQRLMRRVTFAPRVDPEQVGRDLLLRSFTERMREEKLGRAPSPIELAIRDEAEKTLGGLRSLSADDTNLRVHTATRLGEGIAKTHRSHSGFLKQALTSIHRSHFGFAKQVFSRAVRFFKPRFS